MLKEDENLCLFLKYISASQPSLWLSFLAGFSWALLARGLPLSVLQLVAVSVSSLLPLAETSSPSFTVLGVRISSGKEAPASLFIYHLG